MGLNPSIKVRIKVFAVQKRSAPIILERVEAAIAKGTFDDVKARERTTRMCACSPGGRCWLTRSSESRDVQ